jgi:parallel beta-helix repeat protein
MKKLWWVSLVAILAVGLAASMVSAATLTVNKPGAGGVPPDYTNIEDAITAASALVIDTILVYPGTYHPPTGSPGGYMVNKPVIIKSQQGADKTKIVTADNDDLGFIITANNVTISGFTIKPPYNTIVAVNTAGIVIGGTDLYTPVSTALTGVTVTKCVVEFFGLGCGIAVTKANGAHLTNNTLRHNYYGVYLYSGNGNHYDILNTEISQNQIYENDNYGVRLLDGDNFGVSFEGTHISSNTFYRNGADDTNAPCNWNRQGIHLRQTHGTIEIKNNKFLKLGDTATYGYIYEDSGSPIIVRSGNKAFNKMTGHLTGGATTID